MEKLTTIQLFAIWALPIIFAVTMHEAAHGWVASKLGDDTALMLGRVSLNPLKHIDLIGTILLPALMLLFSGFVFGWAKPVPINWRNLHHPRRDMALVALAGPMTNFLMAIIWAGIAKSGMILTQDGYAFAKAIYYMGQAGISINLILMILNLLPIPPLDGSRVLYSILPNSAANALKAVEPFGLIVLIILLVVGILNWLVIPPFIILKAGISSLFALPLI